MSQILPYTDYVHMDLWYTRDNANRGNMHIKTFYLMWILWFLRRLGLFSGGGSLSFPQRPRSLLVPSQRCDKHCHGYRHNPTWSTTVLGEPSPRQLRPLARLREPLRPMRRSLPRTGENYVSRSVCTVGITMVKTWSAVATVHHGCTRNLCQECGPASSAAKCPRKSEV